MDIRELLRHGEILIVPQKSHHNSKTSPYLRNLTFPQKSVFY